MSRYRDLTWRYPYLTEAEEQERLALALAGWHDLLDHRLSVKHWACVRHPGDDGLAPTPCDECRQAQEDHRELVTIADLLAPVGDFWETERAAE